MIQLLELVVGVAVIGILLSERFADWWDERWGS